MDYVNIYTPYNPSNKPPELDEDYVSTWRYSEDACGWIRVKCGCKNDNLGYSSNISPNASVGANFCSNCGRATSCDGQSILAARLGLNTVEGV